MLPEETLDRARGLLTLMDAKGMTLATAESCTGGLIAAALTAIAGSSSVVMAGFVTYANGAKQKMVGVQAESLAQYGDATDPEALRRLEARLQLIDGDYRDDTTFAALRAALGGVLQRLQFFAGTAARVSADSRGTRWWDRGAGACGAHPAWR